MIYNFYMFLIAYLEVGAEMHSFKLLGLVPVQSLLLHLRDLHCWSLLLV